MEELIPSHLYSEKKEYWVIVRNIDRTINNQDLRTIFSQYNCLKCKTVFRKVGNKMIFKGL